MKQTKHYLLLFSLAVMTWAGCSPKTTQMAQNQSGNNGINEHVITKERQSKMTPHSVLDSLIQGNREYVAGRFVVRNSSVRIQEAVAGQHPEAIILSCIDARVPVEDIFQRGIGDLFVARVAGNVVNDDILGSIEYATKVSGSKLIVVLGHGDCGAVKSAIKQVKLGNITTLLEKIEPAVERADGSFEGEKKYSNPAYMDAVSCHNVDIAIETIRANSPVIREMEEKGEVMVIGAFYDIHTGEVMFDHSHSH